MFAGQCWMLFALCQLKGAFRNTTMVSNILDPEIWFDAFTCLLGTQRAYISSHLLPTITQSGKKLKSKCSAKCLKRPYLLLQNVQDKWLVSWYDIDHGHKFSYVTLLTGSQTKPKQNRCKNLRAAISLPFVYRKVIKQWKPRWNQSLHCLLR